MELLQVREGEIVGTGGEPVRLRGVCIGGWMNMEGFINGFPGVENGQRQVMAAMLGEKKAEFIFNRWLDYFFGEQDVVFIKQCGANVVRLPLNYRHFEDDAQPFIYLEKGFERLDRALGWCRAHDLYAILDLHAVPGWQNPDWHCDNHTLHALFWQHPHFQDRFVSLWQEIARRYTGDPVVAGYDLMNEPLVNDQSEERYGNYRPGWERMNAVYRRTIDAIREIDPDHIIFLEGDGFASHFDGLLQPYGKNLACSSHNYNRAGWGPGPYPGLHREGFWDRDKLEDVLLAHEGMRYARRHRVPLWVGEFGPVFNGPPEDRPSRLRGMDEQLSVFEQHGVHWTSWTYKDLGVIGWVNVDPQSEYMQLIAPLLKAKLKLNTDSWMYWLPAGPAKALLGEMAHLIEGSLEGSGWDTKKLQSQLARIALGGFTGSLMQTAFARFFMEMTEEQIDAVLQAYALENCRPNLELVDIVKKYMRESV
jgi:hypothetical protein